MQRTLRSLGLGSIWLLAALLVIGWSMAYHGGLAGAQAWLGLVIGVLPPLGLVMVLAGGGLLAFGGFSKKNLAPVAALLIGAMAALPSLWNYGWGVVAYPGGVPAAEQVVEGRWPFAAAGLVREGGLAPSVNRYAVFPALRHAVEIEPDGGCFGQAVLAPVAGTVVTAAPDLVLDNGGAFVVLAGVSSTLPVGTLVAEGQSLGVCRQDALLLSARRDNPLLVRPPLGDPLIFLFHQVNGPALPVRGEIMAPLMGSPSPSGPPSH